MLYSFYLAAFRVPLVYIEDYITNDSLPVNLTFRGWRLFMQDFVAPFYLYLKTGIKVSMKKTGSEFDLESMEYNSLLSGYSFRRKVWEKGFKLRVNRDNSLVLENSNLTLEALCEAY